MIRLSDAEAMAIGSGDVVWRDGFVDAALGMAAREVIAGWNTSGRLREAGVGRTAGKRGIRGDRTTWVERTDPEPMARLFGCFEVLRVELAVQLRLGLARFALQAAHYEPGAGYERHVDALRRDPRRLITAIVYLNPGWQITHGGLLRAWTERGILEVEPRMGRLLLFRSDVVPHAVLPALATRCAVTAWYRCAEAIPLLPDPT